MVSWFTQYPPFKLKTHPCTFLFSGSDVEPKVISHLNCTHWIPRTPSKPCVLFLMFLVFPGHGGLFWTPHCRRILYPRDSAMQLGPRQWGWWDEDGQRKSVKMLEHPFFVWRAVKNLHILHFFWGSRCEEHSEFWTALRPSKLSAELITRRSGEIWDDPLSGSSFVCDILTWSIS